MSKTLLAPGWVVQCINHILTPRSFLMACAATAMANSKELSLFSSSASASVALQVRCWVAALHVVEVGHLGE